MKKIAVVTGASSGMGKDFAMQLSDYFSADEIWLLARRMPRLKELADELEQRQSEKPGKKYPRPRAIEIDLGGRNGTEQFRALLAGFRLQEENSGGFEISVLINNAGFGTYGTFKETELTKELDMIDLNCTALTGLCGLCLPYMHEGSVIINTASLASFLPLGNFAVYGATKAYVLSFTTALAAEVRDNGIKVCALCPGPVSTEFADVASNGSRKNVRHGLDSGKVVAHCLKKAAAGKHIAVYTMKWKFQAWASRFIDRYAGARFTYKYCKRPNGKNGVK